MHPFPYFSYEFYPYIRYLNLDKESTEDNAVAVENKTDTFIYIEPGG
jgi:hypothetical protein